MKEPSSQIADTSEIRSDRFRPTTTFGRDGTRRAGTIFLSSVHSDVNLSEEPREALLPSNVSCTRGRVLVPGNGCGVNLQADMLAPIGPWEWAGPSFLRQGWCDWYPALRRGDRQPAAVQVLAVSVSDELKLFTRQLGRLLRAGLEPALDHGYVQDRFNRGRAWYSLPCRLPMMTLQDYCRPGLSREEAVRLLESLARDLSRAHRVGLCLRPELGSILMEDGQPRILLNYPQRAFGDVTSQARSWTGPPPFPLAFPNEERHFQWTPAGDQYRLAMIACHLLTRVPPFQGAGWDLLLRQWRDPPTLPSTAAGAVLRRALSQKAADRYRSVSAFMSALRRALD